MLHVFCLGLDGVDDLGLGGALRAAGIIFQFRDIYLALLEVRKSQNLSM
jgi:hypothetical protein